MDELISTYRFRIGGQLGPVVVRIWRDTEDGHLSAEYSRYLKTPLQAGISAPEPGRYHQQADEAIRSIAGTLDSEFEQARAEGHQPEETWLRKNQNWA